MSWRCRRVRSRLALYVGDDLTERERRAAEVYVRECPACQEYLASLERSRDALVQLRGEPAAAEPCPSLWPALRNRLGDLPAGPRRLVWLQMGAMAAASIAIAVVLWNRPVSSLPTTRSAVPSSESWTPRGVRAVEATYDDSRRIPEFAPAPGPGQHQSPVRSFYLLESGSPVGAAAEEL